MKGNFRPRLLVTLFTLTIICLVTAASHRLVDDVMPLWAMCCYGLKLLLPDAAMRWLPLLSRAFWGGLLIIGGVALWRRLRQTHHFMSQLNVAVANLRPLRLNTLLAESGFMPPPVTLLVTPAPLAFCYGLLRPRICLSTGLLETLSDKELRAVLLHETYHCRRYDPLRTLLADVLSATFFFLPAVAEWRNIFVTSAELAADRYAIHFAGRPSLAGAMYKLLIHPQAVQSSPVMSGVNRFSATDARLLQLLDEAPVFVPFSLRSLLISSLALMLGCVLLQLALF